LKSDLTILDTDILVALLKGTPGAAKKIRTLEDAGEQISTTTITAYELFKGAQISRKAQENLMQVREMLSSLQILDLSYSACEEASEIYLELRKAGNMIGEFDVLIASIVKTSDESLVTQDAHFELIHGLKLIKW
jgi:tRNA(fMet)-specific endonuclease VapC